MQFVIVVDMQGDFVWADGALPVPDAPSLVAPMQAFLGSLEPGETAGVLFTFDTHDPALFAASPEGQQFPLHCVAGSPGWDSVLDPGVIDPAIPVWRLEKGVFDMWEAQEGTLVPWGGTGAAQDREAFFAALQVDTVVVVGVAADYCVAQAVAGLVARGFAVTVRADLTRGIAAQAPAVFGDQAGVRLAR